MQAIKQAADALQTSEYKIISEAYLYCFGDRPSEDEATELFSRFMMFGESPEWANRFAKAILSDVDANRRINLNSYCLLNMAPRVGSRKAKVSFTVVREQ